MANREPLGPEEGEFFLEIATSKEMKILEGGGYNLPAWEERE
jgi:hypothetical protein